MTRPKYYGIIPARYASSRFPGKPLAEIHGKPMFWHVYNRASQCRELDHVAVATDDRRIETAAKKLNIPVIMTRDDHPSGTDRVYEAATKLNVANNSVVANIQGDEPALVPDMISELIKPFSDPETQVSTLAHVIDARAAKNPDQVKVVLGKDGRAIYFSRAMVPYPRDEKKNAFYGHIGIYAFKMNALKQFVTLPAGQIEVIEKLEQLRLIENHIPIHVVITKYRSLGVDRPGDIDKVVKLIDALAS
ncbi:MAG: 3-deoxy-manno-octulosonate cytidylyltransferase [Dissulfuribacterales bacterium]